MSYTKEEYILFIDETGKTPSNPYFCLAGLIIKRNEYENMLIPQINALKQKFFSKTDIIFHYTDMKESKNEFSLFKDSTVRNRFWTEFGQIIQNTNLYTMGVYFDQKLMKELYGNTYANAYNIAYRNLLENYMHFLLQNNGVGAVCIESRTFQENVLLEYIHFEYLDKGSSYFSHKETSKSLSSIGFITKNDNCIGLQVADIIPARFMRIVNNLKDNYCLNKIFHEKMYCYNTDKEKILGLRNIL